MFAGEEEGDGAEVMMLASGPPDTGLGEFGREGGGASAEAGEGVPTLPIGETADAPAYF